MSREKAVAEICSEMFDKITVIKGYLLLNIERKKVDYSPLILRKVGEMEVLVRKIIDTCNTKEEGT